MSPPASATSAPPAIDLGDPGLYARGTPHELWRRLRVESPVFWNAPHSGRPGFWALTRYEDTVQVLRDARRFSSEGGNMLSTLARGADPAAGRMLVVTDAPRHLKLRQLLARAFAPRTLERLEQTMRATARALVAKAVEQGECDFVADVAARYPVAVICDLLGVPRADWPLMLELTSVAFASDEEPGGETPSAVRAAHSRILLYYAQLADERRRQPRDDLISVLAGAQIDGIPLTTEEILLNCDNLIIGGNETTRHAAAGGLLAFAELPGEWRRLQRDRGLVPSAVEEILRWTSPVMHVLRVAREDVEVRGSTVAAGEPVTVWLAAANRDDAIFAEPGRFDVGRAPNDHLTFAWGSHVCLGAFLARLELRVLLEELLARVRVSTLGGEPERVASTFVCGLKRLPLSLTAL